MLLLSSEDLLGAVFTIYATLFLDFVTVIGGEYIYLTLTITGVKCTEQNGQVEYDKFVSDELETQVQ